jgi:hypothetical protein
VTRHRAAGLALEARHCRSSRSVVTLENMRSIFRKALLAAALALLLPATVAGAATAPFGLTCTADPENGGVRICEGSTATRVLSFDSLPIDVNVVLPATGDSGLPLMTLMHGYGGNKFAPTATTGEVAQLGSMVSYAKRGYAVLSFATRGFKESCGSASSRAAAAALGPDAFAACQRGWIHLDDMRFEARDAQTLMGLLVDQGIADPTRLGVAGVSYGGITSTQLAALNDRMWSFPAGGDPDAATLVPFTSPKGVPMRIAAAGPSIPGSDLAYSLVANGRTTDFQVIDRRDDIDPVGVPKLSYVSGFYGTGNTTGGGYYAPPGADEHSDITTWYGRISGGDPFDEPVAQGIVEEISRWHSGFALLGSDAPAVRAPSPILFANGFTDDLFPVDEALRFYNRARSLFPGTPVSMMFFDYGHARGQSKPQDLARLRAAYAAWFDHYVKGDGPAPLAGVTTLTQTCPKDAPSAGPFTAGTWEAIHPGEVRQRYEPAVTFGSTGGDANVSKTVDPIGGGGACATTDAADQPAAAAATYRVGTVAGGYTLMGAPTVIARIAKTDTGNAQIAARLWDVDGENELQTLVARTLYRPQGAGEFEVFQLHGNGYRFAPGHTAKLELLGADAPYGRPSSGTFTITVSDLELRLPVLDAPDCREVLSHAPPFAAGKPLAPDVVREGTPPCGGVAAGAPVVGADGGPVPAQTSAGQGGSHGSVNGQAVTPAGAAVRPAARKRPRAIRHRLTCRRLSGGRAACRDRGRVLVPRGSSARRLCASGGRVRVRYYAGRVAKGRLRATDRVKAGRRCRFRSSARVRAPGRRVVTTVRFGGNAKLRARAARRGHARVHE